jgi:hypothetical protein
MLSQIPASNSQFFHPDTSHPNTSHSDTPTTSTHLFPLERPQGSTLRGVTNSKPRGGRWPEGPDEGAGRGHRFRRQPPRRPFI